MTNKEQQEPSKYFCNICKKEVDPEGHKWECFEKEQSSSSPEQEVKEAMDFLIKKFPFLTSDPIGINNTIVKKELLAQTTQEFTSIKVQQAIKEEMELKVLKNVLRIWAEKGYDVYAYILLRVKELESKLKGGKL